MNLHVLEINTIQSCAFYFKVYESLLNGEDISEAVTKGRDHLGTDNKDFCNQQLQPIGEPYKNNYFGSPVLFITTNEPVIMIKAVENIPAGDTGESGKQVRFSQLDRASKGAEPVSEDPIRDETKAKGLDELQKGGFDVKKNNLSDKNKQ
jgi:hypothetical protein